MEGDTVCEKPLIMFTYTIYYSTESADEKRVPVNCFLRRMPNVGRFWEVL